MNIEQKTFKEERALFGTQNAVVKDCVFSDGESPIKECTDIFVANSIFRWKYPIWYSKNITVRDCAFLENTRAGVWYVDNISVINSVFDSPKNFRRCSDVTLENVTFTDAAETLWNCKDISLQNVRANGNYFVKDSENITANGIELVGKYCFDGVRNVEIHSGKFIGRDLFWNSENVTVYDSFISGEYIGWNSKNLTFVNCTIQSLQGLCYIDNLVMRGCRLLDTTLAFEYSTIDAQIIGKIDSVINPEGGRLVCDEIGELIMQSDKVDINKTQITQTGQHLTISG